MNTHLNMTMTMTRTNGNVGGNISNIDGTKFGVINNAALQLLLGSKNAAAVVSFETETGWSWHDACTTALETGSANLLATKTAAEIAEFEAVTGWKWSDAVDEAILAETEANLRASRSNRNRVTSVTSESFADKFERETGMTYGDALDMAAERRREVRLFGTRH
jgi:hypothetical protein